MNTPFDFIKIYRRRFSPLSSGIPLFTITVFSFLFFISVIPDMLKLNGPFTKVQTAKHDIFDNSNNDSSDMKEFSHYEPVPGKIIGIWAHRSRMSSIEKLKALKHKWGFNYILLQEADPDTFNSILKAGYTYSDMMVGVTPVANNPYKDRIDRFKGVFAFYVDEPYERGLIMDSLNLLVKLKSPSSKLVISGYRRTGKLKRMADDADIIMYSSYFDWRKIFPGVWISWPVNTDQREDWGNMRELFGEKFSMTWIGAHADRSSYGQLIEHAWKLGLQGIWLYQLEEGEDSDENIADFCLQASKFGFLQKVEKPR